MTLQEEGQLLAALEAGSEVAFRQLVEEYQDQVVNTCLGFVPNLQDAEDIAQEVFIEIYRSISKFRQDAKLSTWIYRIAVTKSLEFIRHRKRKKRAAFFQSLIGLEDDRLKGVQDGFNHPGYQLENQDLAKILYTAIEKLSDNQRTAFTLNQSDGLSVKEVAEIMDLSVSAVEALVHRARKNLRKQLQSYYEKDML
ncbi:MAG: sigma-70 family RNA polymerase sigma factor [Phaeodactylibacter sp.]|nr:sigma-70 family RNA polymerase sigma factor [Phaeodactylibacter sp.]